MYSEAFKEALLFTLSWEGGYVNHPKDGGGPTNKGITQRVYNTYLRKKYQAPRLVRLITDREVAEIYRKEYWDLAGCERLAPKLSIAVFDFSVHSGVPRAARYLRLANNDLEKYLDKREVFLRIIAKGKNRAFLKGWLNRMKALRKYLEG